MKKITVVHQRRDCIGCNSCVNIAPQNWKMNEADGRVDLIGAKEKKGVFVGQIFEFDKEANRLAAEACPVRIIKVD